MAEKLAAKPGSSNVTFGKWYYDDLRSIYRDEKSLYALLRPGVCEGAHDDALEIALAKTKLQKPIRGPTLTWMAMATECGEREACAIWRWLCSLRLCCKKARHPAALEAVP